MRQRETAAGLATRFAARSMAGILSERGWLDHRLEEAAPAVVAWCEDAASLLGAHAQDREGLEELLHLVFRSEAREILAAPESHMVLARNGAREVIRELAHRVLAAPAIDSERFNQIVTALGPAWASAGPQALSSDSLRACGTNRRGRARSGGSPG